MPIISSQTDPYSGSTIAGTWAYCSEAHFGFGDKSGRLVFEVYASKEAAYSGKPPLRVVEFALGYGDIPPLVDLIAANVEAYALLQQAAESLALARPEFAGGSTEEAPAS